MLRIPQSIISLAKLIFVVGLLSGFFYYINNYHNDELKKFYLKFDTWGITQVGRTELDRLKAIDELEYSQKTPRVQRDALKSKTVFLGATDLMVMLALGSPSKPAETNAAGTQQVWLYNFDDYSRPTYLYFEKKDNNWILTKAEKSN